MEDQQWMEWGRGDRSRIHRRDTEWAGRDAGTRRATQNDGEDVGNYECRIRGINESAEAPANAGGRHSLIPGEIKGRTYGDLRGEGTKYFERAMWRESMIPAGGRSGIPGKSAKGFAECDVESALGGKRRNEIAYVWEADEGACSF